MIYSLQKNSQGLLKDASGKPIKTYAGTSSRLAVHYDKYGYVTGLDKDKQKYFERELGLPEGALDRNKDDFYAKWYVAISNGKVLFNDEEPKDQLALAILRHKPNVGTTLADETKPGIEYILTSEDHEARVIVDERSWKKKAFAHFAGMSPEAMRNYLVATGKKVIGLSPEAIEKKVGDDVELQPRYFMEKVLDKDLDLITFVNDLLQYRILHKNGQLIVDSASNETFAYRFDEAVEKLNEADHQTAYINYQKELKKKKAAK